MRRPDTRLGLAALLLLLGCGVPLPDATAPGPADLAGGAGPADGGVRPDGGPLPDGGPGAPRGEVALTYYWVADQGDYTGPDDTALCDVGGRTLATAPLAFARALQLEGTGRLRDGRLLNVGGSCACPSGMTECFVVLDPARYPWGVGAGSRPLQPYRSVAVDRSFLALDTRIYVPELDGVAMPGSYGFVHDGCVVAADTGGAIKGAHLDFFVGERGSYRALDARLELSAVTAYAPSPRCP